MKHLILLFSLLAHPDFLIAQGELLKGQLYHVKIRTNDGSLNERVNIFFLTDSSMFVTNTSLSKQNIIDLQNQHEHEILIKNISVLKIRKKGIVGKGFTVGAAIGATSSLWALGELSIEGEDVSAGAWIGTTFIMTAGSAAIGGALTSRNAIYEIHYNEDYYQLIRPELEQFTLRNNFVLK